MKCFIILMISFCLVESSFAQKPGLVSLAESFIETLKEEQQLQTVYPFESDERFNFHFIPKNNRKGININQLTDRQKTAGLALLKHCLSEQGFNKTTAIMQLEKTLKVIENRGESDHYRDTGNYYFLIFGQPSTITPWGWRFEGHHISFSFSANKNVLVSATPGFLGSNPAIVREGQHKGLQLLKEETMSGFELLRSLSGAALSKAVIPGAAPNDIISFIQRNPVIENSQGISYKEMNAVQKEKLRRIVNVYVHRYTKLFAERMLKDIEKAGLDNLRFVWIGSTDTDSGTAYYYRVQGPTILIEYDNAQNNANHVHSVLRELKNDFGGNILAEHYKLEHRTSDK